MRGGGRMPGFHDVLAHADLTGYNTLLELKVPLNVVVE